MMKEASPGHQYAGHASTVSDTLWFQQRHILTLWFWHNFYLHLSLQKGKGGGGLDFSVMCCCCILITMPDKCWELVFLSIDFYYFQSLMFLKLHSTSFFWNILNFPLHVSSFPPSPLILEEYSFLMALLTLVSLSRSTGAALPSVWHILK